MFATGHLITVAYFNSALKFVAIIALTVVFAYGSYLLIEAPPRR